MSEESPGPAEEDLDRPARDRTELLDLLEVFLLGEEPELTGQQIADEVGLDIDEARVRWRSLGFAAVGTTYRRSPTPISRRCD